MNGKHDTAQRFYQVAGVIPRGAIRLRFAPKSLFAIALIAKDRRFSGVRTGVRHQIHDKPYHLNGLQTKYAQKSTYNKANKVFHVEHFVHFAGQPVQAGDNWC